MKRPAAEEEPQRPPVSGVDPRGFDPLELPEDREVVPIEHPRPGQISGRTEFVEAQPSVSDTTYRPSDGSPATVDSLYNQAYRIQLFTAKVYGEANLARQVAEEIFDRPVFMDYEVPYFKVRVGSFADRDEAEEYLMRAKAAGYTDAWVVMVNVRVKETAPLYDETALPEIIDTVLYEAEELFEDDGP
ncbi:MAG: SPOR domain-containing protein [Candidatus Zixiibacteriota bacterium]|nr:MAG: SPOR domain-containing protein [candidate division Zixibacteria bacterium]